MSSPRERRRNNLRAGVFASLSIIVALAVIVTLTDVREALASRQTQYIATFSVHDGVKSLGTGGEVRVGGLALGKVSEVTFVPDGEDATASEIEVEFSLDRDVSLFPNARIQVGAALIGSEAWLDIVDLGSDRDDDGYAREPVGDGGRFVGQTPPGMLEKMVGPSASEILDNVKRGSEFIGSMDEKYDRDFAPILENANAATVDVREMVVEVRGEHFEDWVASINHVMDWSGELTTDVDAAVKEGHDMLDAGRRLIVENRPKVDDAIDNVRSASTRIDEITAEVHETTLAKVHAVLDEALEAVEHATATTERIRVDYDRWSQDLSASLGSAQLAAQQLKLTMVEVRRSPWKILYRPSDTELEHELLYEAARSFALATADLKAAAVAVERVLDTHGDQLRSDPELMDRVQRNLIDPLRNYESAQQRLLDVLLVDP